VFRAATVGQNFWTYFLGEMMSGASHEPDDILDDEIIEIFVEEAEEVIAEIDTSLPLWREEPSNRHAVAEIRRAYHTLKGSGRMVKAMEIADLSMRMENLLTKALDGGVAISNAMIDVVTNTRNVIPGLVSAFKNHQAISIAGINLELLKEQIEAVTRGEQFQVVQTTSTPPILHVPNEPSMSPTAKPSMANDILHAEMFELIRRVDVCATSADEALGTARKVATKLEQLNVDTQDLVSQADLSEYRQQLQLMSKELQDLRYIVKATSEQLASQVTDSKQALERRITEKVQAFADTKNELSAEIAGLKQQIDDSRKHVMKVAGGFAAGALGLALLVMLIVHW
jgi:chemotaxis protein histidine kinase CheA